jgi:O-antigen ligase
MLSVAKPVEGQLERSEPKANRARSLTWELPFWFSLSVWSLLPSSKTPWFEIGSIPVSSKEIMAMAVMGFYLLQTISSSMVNQRFLSSRRPVPRFRKPWHHRLPTSTMLMLLYAAISVIWSGMSPRDTAAMLYTLMGTASALLLGYYLIANRSAESVRSFLWWLTVFLAGIGLLYSAESFFSLGLRSELGKEPWNPNDFGIQRVRGPLFISSMGHFILIPALAFCIQETIQNRAGRLLKLGVVSSLLATIIGLGSRAGLILLGLFFLFLIFFLKGRQRFFVILMVMIVTIIAATLIFSKARTDRLRSLRDDSRAETHRAAWGIVTHRSIIADIFGSGYGSYWNWYLKEGRTILYDWQVVDRRIWTPFGLMLHHPHSVLLLLAVEMGVVGLLYFVALWAVLARIFLHNLRGGSFSIFTSGVVASGFSMFFDLFFFKPSHLQFNALWWIFLFGALALINNTRPIAREYQWYQRIQKANHKVNLR